MCIQETRIHAICNHAAVDRIECPGNCAHFDTIEIQLSTYCQSCRQHIDNTAILDSVLRWKLSPCPARRKKKRPVKEDAPDASSAPGTAKPSPRPARKLSGAKSLGALREAASAPPTRELPPTPKRLDVSASVGELAVSLDNLSDNLGLASPTGNTPGPRYWLDVKPAPPSLPLRRRASAALGYAAGGNAQPGLTRAHTVPKGKARPASPQRAKAYKQQLASRTPTRDASRAEKLKSPGPPLQQVPEELRPRWSAQRARDTDSDSTASTRPSTAMTASTMTVATRATSTTITNDTPRSTQAQRPPLCPPPPPPPSQQLQQETQQPPTVSASMPRSLWSLRRSRSSARILALASTRDYVHAKLCGGKGHGSAGSPPPSAPGKKYLFPAAPAPPQQQQQQQQQKKKPIDIKDPEWLASHGLKWDARGLGLVSAAV